MKNRNKNKRHNSAREVAILNNFMKEVVRGQTELLELICASPEWEKKRHERRAELKGFLNGYIQGSSYALCTETAENMQELVSKFF